MINSIYFHENNSGKFVFPETGNFLTSISHINIFIGSNNSGKSRFIRHCFFERKLSFILTGDRNLNNIKKEAQNIISNLSNHLDRIGIGEIKNEIPLLSKFEDNKMNDIEFMDSFARILHTLSMINDEQPLYSYIERTYNKKTNIKTVIDSIKNVYIQLSRLPQKSYNETQLQEPKRVNRIYIPTLRGLRPLYNIEEGNKNSIDLYAARTSKDYFTPKIHSGIFTGHSMFEEVKKHLLGDESDRVKITGFEKFLSDHIFKEKVTLIPKYEDDVLHIKIGESAQRPVYALGDGIQTIIITLFPVFMNKDKTQQVFIEEPETHLHPRWQRIFIDALKTFPNQQFFITTHSSIFINLPDTSIYEVRNENDKTKIRHIPLKTEQRRTLFNLGYRSSDILQTNYLLWVEGPSDRIYFKYWIKQMAPDLEYGIHYTILPMGGENYKHILDAENLDAIEVVKDICLNFGVCLDSDRAHIDATVNIKKLSLIEKIKESGHFTWITSKREIENYIPLSLYINAVKKAHQVENITIDNSDYGDRQKYQKLDIPTNYKQNIRIEDDIWKKIQSGGIEALKEIKAGDLKKSIVNSIKNTASNTSKTDKILVAEEVVKLEPEIDDPELTEKITDLVNQIKRANQ